MNDLYEALEICLREMDQGASIETVLFRYPDQADELRPLLEGALYARNMAIVGPSAEAFQRNRAKVLRQAAQLREAQAFSSRRVWFASLRRLAMTMAVVIALLISGTGLVRAASTTLPGDNLYPVKRTWEDVLVLFTLNLQHREALELEHENERLHELRELFEEGRSAEVDFAGLVTAQAGDAWIIGGFPVLVSPQTEIRDGQMAVGSAVRVEGQTRADGVILAKRVQLLPSNVILPDEVELENESHEGSNQQEQNSENSGPGSENEGPKIEETQSPESESESSGESSHSGSSNETRISDSNENSHESDRSGEDHSGSSNNENEGIHDNSGEDHSGGNSNEDSGSHSGEDNSGGGGEDNSGSGGD